MTDLQEKTHKKFTEILSKGLPVYWWYDYEDAVFRSHFEDGDVTRFYVKYAWNKGDEFELFKKDSNVLMDSISDLDKVLITKEEYENFPQKIDFKK
jgi:Uma2 family endonuclease